MKKVTILIVMLYSAAVFGQTHLDDFEYTAPLNWIYENNKEESPCVTILENAYKKHHEFHEYSWTKWMVWEMLTSSYLVSTREHLSYERWLLTTCMLDIWNIEQLPSLWSKEMEILVSITQDDETKNYLDTLRLHVLLFYPDKRF